MQTLTRLRAYAGLWSVVALLGVAAVFVTATAGPVFSRIEDRALRQSITGAPYTVRDLTFTQPTPPHVLGRPDTSPGILEGRTLQVLPWALANVVERSWVYQRTGVSTFESIGATLTGDGVVAAPDGYAPVISFHHQPETAYSPGLADDIELVEGTFPETDPAGDVIEVMAAVEVAQRLGLIVGGEYALHSGQAVNLPDASPLPDRPTVRLAGVFEPRDAAAPVWEHASLLLRATTTTIPIDQPPLSTLRAALVTDNGAFTLLAEEGLAGYFEPDMEVRVRLDLDRLDAAWVPAALEAVARLRSNNHLQGIQIGTGLTRLLDAFAEQAVATRAVVAVAGAGMVGTLVGLLALAARLVADRRRSELALLRARGGSTLAVAGRLTAEAGWTVVPAGLVGWLLHWWVIGDPAGGLRAAAAATAVALLVVPVAGIWTLRRSPAASRVGRSRLPGLRSGPVRLTAEAAVVLLAGLGVLLMHQRGLDPAGVDPYLSAVPVLLGVAAGLVALRVYPWPLRALAVLAGRMRGVVGFVGLARAGRAAPGAALGLLVLVLATAVSGFGAAVGAGLADGRETAAAQRVGAHVRLAAAGMPAEAAEAVAALPGVTAVAAADRSGTLRDVARRTPVQAAEVVVVDTVALQQVLAAVGFADMLPDEIVSAAAAAAAGTGPVPVLASPAVVRAGGLAVRLGDDEYPVTVVGDVAGLPGPDRDRSWVLVPGQALPAPAEVDELLVAGADADPDQVRDTVAAAGTGGVALTSIAQARAELEQSPFNDALTLVFFAGTIGGGLGGVLAVALALVLQAHARGRALSVLRTMGLSVRQARGLLAVELLPLTALAVAAGAAAGFAMPQLLAPALGLERFTGGVPPAVTIEPATVGVLAGLVVALVLAGAAVETAVNRRLGLGQAVRVE